MVRVNLTIIVVVVPEKMKDISTVLLYHWDAFIVIVLQIEGFVTSTELAIV